MPSQFSQKYILITFLSLCTLWACKSTKKATEAQAKTQEEIIPTTPVKERKIKTATTILEVDKLENIYVVDDKNNIKLYGADGVMKVEYNDNRAGKVSSIDPTNPMSLAVFYKNQGLIKLLDNKLGNIKTIDLNSKAPNTYTAICVSNDNNFWGYDYLQAKVFKFTHEQKIVAETNRFMDIDMTNVTPSRMVERGNKLLVFDEQEGFFIFDNFGQFIKKVPVSGVKDFQFDGRIIVYKTMTGLKSVALDFLIMNIVGVPAEIEASMADYIKVTPKNWVIAYPEGIDIVPRAAE